MKKTKISVLIPLAIVGGILIYCWTILITTDLLATWRHYLGAAMYFTLIGIIFKSWKYTTVGLGVYLLFASFALLAITPSITTSWIRIGPISTPPVQLLSLGIFILYAILNFNPLLDFYLDHEEGKVSKKTQVVEKVKPVEDINKIP